MNFDLKYIIGGVFIFLLSWLGNRLIIPFLLRKGWVDIPNERSSHTDPTPRGGGIIFVLVISIACFYLFYQEKSLPYYYSIIIIVFGGVNFIDDQLQLSAKLRLGIQLVFACIIIYTTNPIDHIPLPPPLSLAIPYWLGFSLSVLWVIGVTNFYNFLDGIDGFAGSQTLLSSCFLSFFFPEFQLLFISIALVSAGFLIINWHPAKLFLGDVGSSTLGFVFATIPFYVSSLEIEKSVFITSMLLWFFLSDGLYTLIKRISNGEKFGMPHRTHLYQRLVVTGWSHSKVVLFIMTFSLIVSSLVYLNYLHFIPSWYVWLGALMGLLILIGWVNIREKNV